MILEAVSLFLLYSLFNMLFQADYFLLGFTQYLSHILCITALTELFTFGILLVQYSKYIY